VLNITPRPSVPKGRGENRCEKKLVEAVRSGEAVHLGQQFVGGETRRVLGSRSASAFG
jgi:hypothetical protein